MSCFSREIPQIWDNNWVLAIWIFTVNFTEFDENVVEYFFIKLCEFIEIFECLFGSQNWKAEEMITIVLWSKRWNFLENVSVERGANNGGNN